MTTIAHAVKDELSRRPFIEETLRRGLINIVALSEYLQPVVEEELGIKVKQSAISMAVRRYVEQSKGKPFSDLSLSRGSDINLRTDLFEISLEKSDTSSRSVQSLYPIIDFKRGDTLNIIQDNYEILVLSNRKYKKSLMDALLRERIIKVKDDLAAITVDIPKSCIDVPGYFYIITRAIAWSDISIVDIVNTRDSATFVFYKKDATRAYNVFRELFD